MHALADPTSKQWKNYFYIFETLKQMAFISGVAHQINTFHLDHSQQYEKSCMWEICFQITTNL